MKNNNSKALVLACLFAGSLLVSIDGNSQDRKKLPDGSIVYSDGTRRLPNGTVIYKGGNNGNNNNYPQNNGAVVALPDGTVVYPDGSRRFPNGNTQQGNRRYEDRRNGGRNNGGWLPPGQAKKMYGGKAKDYAKGQQKEWKDDEDNDGNDRNDHGKGKGHKDRD